MAISTPPKPSGRTGRARINLGMFGNPSVAGLIGFIGLLVAIASGLIAYLDWQGNVAERAATTVTPAPSVREPAATPSVTPAPSVTARSTAPISAPATTGVAPPTVTDPPVIRPATRAAAEDLTYRLSSSPVDSHTVNVSAKASGEPVPGLTYWFVLEVNWGGNIDYYPRRTMTGRSSSFEVPIPPDADPQYVRQGRIYALNSGQNAQAETRLQRQGTTKVDDYFADATGQVASNVVTLPY